MLQVRFDPWRGLPQHPILRLPIASACSITAARLLVFVGTARPINRNVGPSPLPVRGVVATAGWAHGADDGPPQLYSKAQAFTMQITQGRLGLRYWMSQRGRRHQPSRRAACVLCPI